MPLPPAEQKGVMIIDFQGVNVERNELVRPESSWQQLENFDLVKPGVIRKILGNKRLTIDPVAGDFIVAFRDYQKVSTGPELLVVITAGGKIYFSGMTDDPIALVAAAGELFDGVTLGVMDEAPFVVSLPFNEDGEQVQYIVTTIGDKGFPQKWNGLVITRLGIANPGDLFTVPYEHSIALPQLLYNDAAVGRIYHYTSPNPDQGIPVVIGKQYRASWYDPTTGHDSSLFPLHLGEYATDFNLPQNTSVTKKLGTLVTQSAAPFVMAAPMFFDNLPERTVPLPAITDPQTGYTKFRIWTTKDGGPDFYLLPRLYDKYGRLISDENGAVDIDGFNYGFYQIGNTNVGNDTPIYDGFIPLKPGVIPPLQGFWTQPFIYSDTATYVVTSGGQTGNHLLVTKSAGETVDRARFTVLNDSTIYAIISSVDLGGGDFDWEIDPPLAQSPPVGQIAILFVKPVADVDLVTLWNNSGESPFDRVNDPPPESVWGAIYQGRLFLLGTDRISLYYSRIGDWEDFPPNNVFRFAHNDFDPITAILSSRQVGLVSEGADQRLLIAKEQSTYQITGTSILDFQVTGMFPETGIVHKRAAIIISGTTVGLSRQGLEILQEQAPYFIGSLIKDIIDRANILEYGPCFALDRVNNQILLGLSFVEFITTMPTITAIISMRNPRPGQAGPLSPFATITALPGGPVGVIQECGFGLIPRMLCAGFDGHIYQLFTGGLNVLPGGDTEPINSVAISQALPQSDRELRKIFRRIRFDGNGVNDDNGWAISFSVDNNPFTDEVRMYEECLIGLVGKQLRVKIRHDTEIFDEDEPPQLSNMTLFYALIGEAR